MSSFGRLTKSLCGPLIRRINTRQTHFIACKTNHSYFRITASIYGASSHYSLTRRSVQSMSDAAPLDSPTSTYRQPDVRTRDRTVLSREFDLLQDVDSMIMYVERTAQKYGTTALYHVNKVLQMALKEESISEQNLLMLLRATGRFMVRETEETRQRVFREVWEARNKLGIQPSVRLYNTAYKVRLQNGEKIEPEQVLQDISDAGLTPNKVTFHLLIDMYCEKGDIAGAEKVLEHMKAENLTTTEQVFNSLVKGYMTMGDQTSAENVITTMKSSGIEPTCHTYQALALPLAVSGDLAGVQSIITRAMADEEGPTSSQLLTLYVALCEGGTDPREAEAVLAGVDTVYDNAFVHNSMIKLVIEHKTNTFEKLFEWYFKNCVREQDGELFGRRSKLLQATMDKARWPITDIMAFHSQCHTLASEAQKTMEFDQLTQDYTTYWIAKYSQDNDTQGLYGMAQYLCQIMRRETSLMFRLGPIIRAIISSESGSTEQLISTLKGYRPESSSLFEISIPLLSAIRNRDLDAIKNMQISEENQESLSRSLDLIISELPHVWSSDPDPKAYVQLLKTVSSLYTRKAGFNTNALRKSLHSSTGLSQEDKQAVIQQYAVQNMLLFPDILQHKELATLDQEVIQKLKVFGEERPQSNRRGYDVSNNQRWLQASVDALEAEYNNGERHPNIYNALVGQHAKNENLEKAEHYKQEMIAAGYTLAPLALLHLGNLYAKRGDLAAALEHRNSLKISRLGPLAWNIALLYLKQGNKEEALREINSVTTKENYGLINLLMKESAKSSTPEFLHQVLMLLVESGAVEKTGKQLFGLMDIVIGHYSESGDIDTMMSLVEDFFTNYGYPPANLAVLRTLVQRDDTKRLQTIVDMCSPVMDQNYILHKLLHGFVSCNKAKQARKLVKTPGLRAIPTVLNGCCEYYSRNNMEKELQLLVEVTRDLSDIDRDQMIYSLINFYVLRKDWARALDSFGLYEEENIVASLRTLQFFGNALKSNGQKVPFSIPGGSEQNSELDQKLLDVLSTGNLDKSLKLKKEIDNSGFMLRPETSLVLANTLLINRQYVALRAMVDDMGQLGDWNGLMHIKLEKPEILRHVQYFDKKLFVAAINSGRTVDMLDLIADSSVNLEHYITAESLQVLSQKSHEQFQVVESLIYDLLPQSPEGYAGSTLFTHYVFNGEYDKATQIGDALEDKLKINYLVGLCRQKGKEAELLWLSEYMQGKGGERLKPRLSFIYSALLHMTVFSNDHKSALKHYHAARALGLENHNLWARPMLRLEKLLQQAGEAVPWEIGSIQANFNTNEISKENSNSTSSSSDSDSDTNDSKQKSA